MSSSKAFIKPFSSVSKYGYSLRLFSVVLNLILELSQLSGFVASNKNPSDFSFFNSTSYFCWVNFWFKNLFKQKNLFILSKEL